MIHEQARSPLRLRHLVWEVPVFPGPRARITIRRSERCPETHQLELVYSIIFHTDVALADGGVVRRVVRIRVAVLRGHTRLLLLGGALQLLDLLPQACDLPPVVRGQLPYEGDHVGVQVIILGHRGDPVL